MYVILARENPSELYPTAKIQQNLTFTITEIDLDTEEEAGSYEEDYDVEDVSIAVRDYVKAELIPTG